MEANCIRQTALPHTSRLFADYSYQFERVARFYAHNPHDGGSYGRSAASIDFPDERRRALVAALRRQNGDSPSLDLLAQPGTVAVVTGQQVGLFSGPCYTIYKALTAAKLASRLSDEGIPAVPVFWLATEDHDFAEVDHAWAFGGDHQPAVLRASAKVNGGQRPVGGIPLDDVPADELRELLGPFPFGDDVAAEVAATYRSGATMGAAFRGLLRRLLGRFDLLYLDPLAEEVRQLGAPLLAEAVRTSALLKARLEERNGELTSAGYHAQVHVEAQTSLLFLLDGGRRIGLKFHSGEYAGPRGERYSAADLAERADHLSPNALLRPVMQDYLLPTAAYVGGPAELAYLGQSKVLYDELLGRMPVAVHRAGFTLLDARARKLVNRYALDWSTLYQGEDGIREAIGQRLVPPGVREALEESRGGVKSSLDRLGGAIPSFDPTLGKALAKSRVKIEYQLAKMDRKVARESLRRDQRAMEESHFLAGLLYPNKHLQERLYTILPFLAKHGFELIDTIHDAIRPECPDHCVLTI